MKKIKSLLTYSWGKVKSALEWIGGTVGAVLAVCVISYVAVKLVKLIYVYLTFLWNL